jgi:hypothetical protein
MLRPLLAAVAAAGLISLGACEQRTTVDADTAAEDAAENAADEIEQAGENVENAAEEAGEEIEQAGENAADAANDATDGNPNTNP